MKRTVLSYLFTLCVMIFCFSAVYYFNYARLKREMAQREDSSSQAAFGQNPSEDETDESQPESKNYYVNASGSGNELTDGEEKDGSVREADAGDELRTSSSMVYVVGQYDWSTGTVTETVERFPEELLDMTRQELLVFLRDHPEYGTLLSFSEHAVYLRKTDDMDWSEYMYFLILEDDGLMVYYPDQMTVYLDTGITAEELGEENRELLEEGFYIKDTSDLFDYLQTVTS